MTQHYGIRQLAFRKSWSATIALIGLNLFTSSWPSTTISGVVTFFLVVFTIYYLGRIVRCHRSHVIYGSLGGLLTSFFFALLLLRLDFINSPWVDSEGFDGIIWAKSAIDSKAIQSSIVYSRLIGVCFAIVFGMIGLNGKLFKSTSGIFLGVFLGFTPTILFMMEFGVAHEKASIATSIGLQSAIWIGCYSSVIAAMLALGERLMKAYAITMSYERTEDED